jgi:adenylate cyclase
MTRAGKLPTAIAIVLAGLWAAALALGQGSEAGFLDRFEGTLTDLRVLARGVRTPPDRVTIVAIDDATARDQGSYPLPRAKLAELIDAIARHRPRLVVVDVLLVDAGPPDGDAALARALGSTNAVIAAAAIFDHARQAVAAQHDSPLSQLPTAARFLLPLPLFAAQAGVGVVNVTTDPNGIPRSIPMLFRSNDAVMVSLPLRAASAASHHDPKIASNRLAVAGADIATDAGHLLPLSFYGPNGSIRTVSAGTVLNGQAAPDDIEGRVVVIGVTVTGGGDVFQTPFDPVMPGVEVISTGITHLLAGDTPLRNAAVRRADAAIAIVLAMLSVGLLAWRRNLVGLVAIAAVIAVWATINVIAFAHGIWMSAALPIAAAAPPVLLFGALQIWSGRRQTQHLTARSRLMRQFQAPGLREWLLADPDFLLQPVQQQAAVVFIDLSRFTALSETLDAETVRDVLKSFHALVDRAAVENGGVVTSFMGDGAMILFGLPKPAEMDAGNASRCCVALSRRTTRWLVRLPNEVSSRIGFKIGGHYGEIIASRLGGDSHQHITAIGDTVNIASRLMEVASQHGAPLAVSDDLLRAAGHDGALQTEGMIKGPVQTLLRGRIGSVTVCLWFDHQVTSQPDADPEAIGIPVGP